MSFVFGSDVRERLVTLRSSRRGTIFPVDLVAGEPIKWLKYVLLHQVGIEALPKLRDQVHRYQPGGEAESLLWCKDAFTGDDSSANVLVVAKVVPWHVGSQLRNFRMSSRNSVVGQLSEAWEYQKERGGELWCCRSSTATDGLNVGGRFIVSGEDAHLVYELVWFGSPRMVESIGSPSFGLPAARFRVDDRSAIITYDELFLPNDSELSESDLMLGIAHVLDLLDTRRDGVSEVVELLGSMGVSEVSFCFKVSDGLLTIIDWDTILETISGLV